jgi:hypothetical protein
MASSQRARVLHLLTKQEGCDPTARLMSECEVAWGRRHGGCLATPCMLLALGGSSSLNSCALAPSTAEPHAAATPQLQCADEGACRWRWLARRRAAGAALPPGAGQENGAAARGAGEEAEWREVGASRVYTPAEEDAGGWLRVECTPVARRAARRAVSLAGSPGLPCSPAAAGSCAWRSAAARRAP